MAFEKREMVIHPAHGVAEVVGREKREIDGKKVIFLVLEVPARPGISSVMRVSLPEDRADEIGLRAAVDTEEASDVLEVLGVQGVRVPTNWSRRFKNHQEKLRSGDVYQCAEVVRNLAQRERGAKLSTGEQTMYQQARYRLTSELAVSWGVDAEEADARVASALDAGVASA
jgi:CarD family transcriptional regulator